MGTTVTRPGRTGTIAALCLALAAGPMATEAAAEPAIGGAGIRVTLPPPAGKYPVGTVALHLVDRSRPDPWVAGRAYRELMVSVWYPARRKAGLPTAPYMSPLAAADFGRTLAPGEVDWAGATTHSQEGAPMDRTGGRLPVVLYSPGFRVPRTFGTTVVEDLASRGYVVVSVDHTYETAQVEFPGGRLERTDFTAEWTAEDMSKAVDVRVDDMTFVLDQLARLNLGHNPDADRRRLPAGLRGGLNLSRIGALGHSMGGSSALQLAHDDRRVDAGVNLDGGHRGPVAQTGLAKPFLQMAAESHTRASDPTWQSLWDRSTGWKRELRFTGAEHISFSDAQALVPQYAEKLNVDASGLIGTIDPSRSLAAQRAYSAAFFDLHLKKRGTLLFDRPSPRHPEVTLIP
ncbi:Platelet-activating factor acetylhydrolase, isoform II [Nonomuraea solani]|uniref:Platelet-activating factor acetylhydrolase, isoform II n=1 Tax=Nonomuraea solani TaxID=1144553 RepID=A0A1H5Y9D0_9ACTN|nr:lipase [Nonomuraea solani]SEG20076.1 Platelet-activating factor acetylhydrolase, isoform II [Nonomuraea solani]